jgi:uncharacterized protein (TIGR03382 family)
MKTKQNPSSRPRRAALALLVSAMPASAATISENAITSGEGVPYKWEVGLSGNDSATVIRHVGAWSWEDNALFASGENPVGWTHTSDWLKLSLSDPATFTLTLSRELNVAWPSGGDPTRTTGSSASFFPSFTIYSGMDTTGTQDHTYNNKPGFDALDTGAIGWADPLYLAHVDNSTLESVSLTLSLAAGDYSIALGSNAPATDANRQGYRALLTTVPEPGSLAFLALTGLAALRRRR